MQEEILPPDDANKEAQLEAQLFAQAGAIDNLLKMIRSLEGSNQDIADNDELQVSKPAAYNLSCADRRTVHDTGAISS